MSMRSQGTSHQHKRLCNDGSQNCVCQTKKARTLCKMMMKECSIPISQTLMCVDLILIIHQHTTSPLCNIFGTKVWQHRSWTWGHRWLCKTFMLREKHFEYCLNCWDSLCVMVDSLCGFHKMDYSIHMKILVSCRDNLQHGCKQTIGNVVLFCWSFDSTYWPILLYFSWPPSIFLLSKQVGDIKESELMVVVVAQVVNLSDCR